MWNMQMISPVPSPPSHKKYAVQVARITDIRDLSASVTARWKQQPWKRRDATTFACETVARRTRNTVKTLRNWLPPHRRRRGIMCCWFVVYPRGTWWSSAAVAAERRNDGSQYFRNSPAVFADCARGAQEWDVYDKRIICVPSNINRSTPYTVFLNLVPRLRNRSKITMN